MRFFHVWRANSLAQNRSLHIVFQDDQLQKECLLMCVGKKSRGTDTHTPSLPTKTTTPKKGVGLFMYIRRKQISGQRHTHAVSPYKSTTHLCICGTQTCKHTPPSRLTPSLLGGRPRPGHHLQALPLHPGFLGFGQSCSLRLCVHTYIFWYVVDINRQNKKTEKKK